MEEIKITKGWFNSAGHKYKWIKDYYHIFGVGIDQRMISGNGVILITIENKQYSLDKSEARQFSLKYNSRYKAGKTMLCVVSKSILRPLFKEEVTNNVDNFQPNLFDNVL